MFCLDCDNLKIDYRKCLFEAQDEISRKKRIKCLQNILKAYKFRKTEVYVLFGQTWTKWVAPSVTQFGWDMWPRFDQSRGLHSLTMLNVRLP